MESSPRLIRREVTLELLRIIGFVMYYIILILTGMGIFVGVFYASKFLALYVIPEIGSGRIIILLLLVILAMWTVAALFALYLIKPLFSFSKNTNPVRVEITKEDCPELFEMVSDLAARVGCKMPKHVYLTPDVNACVFYNTSFWSIFFPVRKNLEIGLGLFDGTSMEELKSILAHEFGHFSQKSMKVGSTVYVANSILYNITFQVDFWDRLLDKMTLSEHRVWRAAGGFTRWFTNGIGRINAWLYGHVQKGYMKLSRQMEYDADNISCSIVGKEVFKSAMCKIETLSFKDSVYRSTLKSMLNKDRFVNDYFVGKAISSMMFDFKGHPDLSYDCMLHSLVKIEQFPSRIKVDNLWSSHPSIEDRLANADKSPVSNIHTVPVPSWSLISDKVRDKVSDNYIGLYKKAYPEIEILDEDGIRAFIQNYLDNTMPEKMRPFFNRHILYFDIKEAAEAFIAEPDMEVNPFTELNLETLEEFKTAIRDHDTLEAVATGEIEAKEIMYKGKIYSKDALPREQHADYLRILFERVRKIDRTMFLYVLSVVPASMREAIYDLYNAVFYVDDFNGHYSKIRQVKESLVAELNRPIRRDEEEYSILVGEVNSFDRQLNKLIDERCSRKYMSMVLDEDELNQIKGYVSEGLHGRTGSIDMDALEKVLNMADFLGGLHSRIEAVAKGVIIDHALYIRPFIGLPKVADSAVRIREQVFEHDEFTVKAFALDFQQDQTVVFQSFKSKDNGGVYYSSNHSCLEDDKARQYRIVNSTIPFEPNKFMTEDNEEYLFAESFAPIPDDVITISLKVGDTYLFKNLDIRSIRRR